ncbi:MAG: phospho-N-acetylmuramoyl-pentapeptide-transferase [Bacteroidales bacterium]|nr:phospho-N-acetylmuramoyl-pentapeptide-transferase [Bacteroidales bacterium]MCR5243352.1 phospho-N-acetylmuramoyl-pentapeptide-transferase [Bacteroidales bacterium]
MIYHLFEALKEYDIPGQGLFTYLSFRAILASVTAMGLSTIAGKRIIAWLRKKNFGEAQRDLGTEGAEAKAKTPSMGGVIIILSILVPVLLFCDLTNIYVQLLILTTVWCGGLGFADDYIKIFKHDKGGVSENGKLGLQILLGLIIGLTVWNSSDIVVREKVPVQDIEEESIVEEGRWKNEDVVKSTKTTIPFVKDHEFDYKSLSPFRGTWGWYAKWGIYVVMIILVVTACSNGANLTDGMDGLSAGTSAIVGTVLGILAWLGGNIVNSNYLNIMYIPGSGEIAIFMSAFVGALIGFLWFNAYPAQVFMGDTGSLTIGGIIGVSAILIRKELLLPILCGIFVAESVTVLVQRLYFKCTKKKYGQGRRIWSSSPLHHHFQKKKEPEGMVMFHTPVPPHHEAKIVSRFWIIGIILAVSTLALLKLR